MVENVERREAKVRLASVCAMRAEDVARHVAIAASHPRRRPGPARSLRPSPPRRPRPWGVVVGVDGGGRRHLGLSTAARPGTGAVLDGVLPNGFHFKHPNDVYGHNDRLCLSSALAMLINKVPQMSTCMEG